MIEFNLVTRFCPLQWGHFLNQEEVKTMPEFWTREASDAWQLFSQVLIAINSPAQIPPFNNTEKTIILQAALISQAEDISVGAVAPTT
jgi:hypothetical protein